jgi:hypothetical protein
MNKDFTTYTNGNGKHAYDVEVFVDAADPSKGRKTFEVHANNRDQAARRVSRDGFVVCSVNMVG